MNELELEIYNDLQNRLGFDPPVDDSVVEEIAKISARTAVKKFIGYANDGAMSSESPIKSFLSYLESKGITH